MYTQLIGCIIMGFIVFHKSYLNNNDTSTRYSRLVYLSITSGLCGSITTFSSWQLECSKNFFMQWDTSWLNYYSSYNAGRLLEWIVSLWIGTVVPLSALQFGIYLASFSPYSNGKWQNIPISDPNESRRTIYELFIIIWFFFVTIIVIVVPIIIDYNIWDYLTYSAVLGCLGAYVRYQLSKFNVNSPTFPIGTFPVNILGTWILAAVMMISKFSVAYYNTKLQAVLYGLAVGFCGCLTTVSTYVNEINGMSMTHALKYGIASNLLAQVGVILILNVYTYTTVPRSITHPISIHICLSTSNLCDSLLNKIGCPESNRINIACYGDIATFSTSSALPSSYSGQCLCGSFHLASNRIQHLLVNAKTFSSLPNLEVKVWPTNAHKSMDPAFTYDYCLTFEAVCHMYLSTVNCPVRHQYINGCHHRGIQYAASKCTCGSSWSIGNEIKDIIFKSFLAKTYDTLPYLPYLTSQSINFSQVFSHYCKAALSHIQCPKNIILPSTSSGTHFSLWNHSHCACGSHLEITSSISSLIVHGLLVPVSHSLMTKTTRNNTKEGVSTDSWDICSSYSKLCNTFLDYISCPIIDRHVLACNKESITSEYPYGRIEYASSQCRCQTLHIGDDNDDAVLTLIIDSLLEEDIKLLYYYVPPSISPYDIAIGSNPFKQFLF